jgi:CubicO group peptidase (beta-lactamase class C family)
MPTAQRPRLTRRTILRTAAGAALGAASAAVLPGAALGQLPPVPQASGGGEDVTPLFRALDAKIEAAMAEHRIPGVAVGVWCRGQEHVRGFGVGNVDFPQPVDGDTLFRIGSTNKTFTGTTVMRLVEKGLLALDAPVRSYLPGFRTSDDSVAARVTVRQILNHSAGWLGDDFRDFGRGADAIGRYVQNMATLPQLTPLGEVFAYNNAAVVLAGRVIEAATGKAYEDVVLEEILKPLGLDHTGFFTDELIGYTFAASHRMDKGRPVVDRSLWPMPRTLNPTGALISSARDQLRYARFHMSDGAFPARGTPLLSAASFEAMRSPLGPGGTLGIEIDGVGVTWWKHSTADGVPVFQHGGDWTGQHSGFLFVPGRDFAMTLLTNSTSGPKLTAALFYDDWALRLFADVSNPPAIPLTLGESELAPFVGRYVSRQFAPGEPDQSSIELRAVNGRLEGVTRAGEQTDTLTIAFYRQNYVVAIDPEGRPTPDRADFVVRPDGSVAFFRTGGRLFAKQG